MGETWCEGSGEEDGDEAVRPSACDVEGLARACSDRPTRLIGERTIELIPGDDGVPPWIERDDLGCLVRAHPQPVAYGGIDAEPHEPKTS